MPIASVEQVDRVLAHPANAFVEDLTRGFRPRIEELLDRRRAVQQKIDARQPLDFLADTAEVRKRDWRVAPIPHDLQDRRVEITATSAELQDFLTLPAYDILVKTS